MKKRYHPAALALLLLAAPALASPREDSECLVGRLSTDDVSVIVAELQTGGSEMTVARLGAPVEACSEGQDWTPDRRGNAAAYTIGALTRDTLGRQLGAEGIDTVALDRWFARQSVEFRTTAFTTMARADLEATVETLVGNELSAEAMDRSGPTIGGYLSGLMIIERIERGLGM